MKTKSSVLLLLILAVAWPLKVLAQRQPVSSNEIDAPLLTLDDAVSLAVKNNRLVKNYVLETQKADFQVNAIRTRRLPHTQIAVLGGEVLQPFNFTFNKGVFGTYPTIGPVPGTKTEIKNPAVFATITTASFNQPLTQQYKISLGIRATELSRQIASEDVRGERQKIASDVRSSYFNLVATQAGIVAASQAVKTLEEAQRITTRYAAEQTVLRGDALEVDARLAKSRYDLTVAENGLVTQRENLNELIGRDLSTQFRVDAMPEDDQTDLTLGTALQQAAQNRPEIRQADLKRQQAEYDRRIAKAEYIPDLSFSVQYLGLNNFQVVPQNVGVAGFLFSWEPFDWGRRHNQIAEKAKTVEQAHNGLKETQAQIAVEVGMKYRKWQEASLLLKASRISQEAAVEQFRVIGNKYKEQAVLIKDLLQAETHSRETAYQYQQALSGYWTALANLRRAMGEE